MLGSNDTNIYGKINGKIQKFPNTINGKLLSHISFLESRGLPNPKNIVEYIWKNPKKMISYDSLIQIAKK